MDPALIAGAVLPRASVRSGIDRTVGLNALSERILGASYAVHSALGPGLLESTYEACLQDELRQAGLEVERQKALPVRYRGVLVEVGYRVDLLVPHTIVLEVKSVSQVIPIHRAQLRTYLKLTGLHLGLLLNFNVLRLEDRGITRLVRDFPPR